MIDLQVRETVILASDVSALVDWYVDVLGFRVTRRFEDRFHYANLETRSGIKLGIGDAKQMGVEPIDRSRNTVLLQFQVADVKALFEHLEARGATVTFGPSYDEQDEFWFGGFADPEGNPIWVVDERCP